LIEVKEIVGDYLHIAAKSGDFAERTAINKPYFLSGGIEPGDAAAIKLFAKDDAARNLFALDVNSKFEVSPGVKNMGLVRSFVEEVRGLIFNTETRRRRE
jgi:phosphoribosylanthranilate isomerase